MRAGRDEEGAQGNVNTVLKTVAGHLGNTPGRLPQGLRAPAVITLPQKDLRRHLPSARPRRERKTPKPPPKSSSTPRTWCSTSLKRHEEELEQTATAPVKPKRRKAA